MEVAGTPWKRQGAPESGRETLKAEGIPWPHAKGILWEQQEPSRRCRDHLGIIGTSWVWQVPAVPWGSLSLPGGPCHFQGSQQLLRGLCRMQGVFAASRGFLPLLGGPCYFQGVPFTLRGSLPLSGGPFHSQGVPVPSRGSLPLPSVSSPSRGLSVPLPGVLSASRGSRRFLPL